MNFYKTLNKNNKAYLLNIQRTPTDFQDQIILARPSPGGCLLSSVGKGKHFIVMQSLELGLIY